MVLYQIIILKAIFRHLSCLQMYVRTYVRTYVCILCMTPSMKTCLSTLPTARLNGHPRSMGWITGNSWFDL
jgi:hypothetical protein